jgi:hypothetical protein
MVHQSDHGPFRPFGAKLHIDYGGSVLVESMTSLLVFREQLSRESEVTRTYSTS